MITYGFYNSINNDRVYDAEQISSIFDGIINNGIYMSIGGQMMVKPNSGLTVKVSSGRAWFKHTWTYNDSDYNMTLDAADPLLNRIDAIILEVDTSVAVRQNSFKILKGTAAVNPSRPALTNTADIGQYALAYINVSAGKTSIEQVDITNMVGTENTPFVTGIIDVMSIDSIVAQWEGEFDEWIDELEEVLDENAAANLYFQIQDLNDYVDDQLETKQNQVTYGTTDLTAGSSGLHTGDIYLMYE